MTTAPDELVEKMREAENPFGVVWGDEGIDCEDAARIAAEYYGPKIAELVERVLSRYQEEMVSGKDVAVQWHNEALEMAGNILKQELLAK